MYNSPASTDNQTNSGFKTGISSNQAGEYHDLTVDKEENFAQYIDHEDPQIELSNKSIPNYLIDTSNKQTNSDVKDFLARPILCPGTQTAWTTAQARGTVLMRMTVPDTILSSSMYSAKISGFHAFRGTLVCKFQTNAQKFQQGILLMSYAPMGPLTSVERFLTANYIWPLSQMPSVRHNIAETNETTLRIPFSSYTNAYSNNNDGSKQPYGYLYFTVYSPAVGGNVPYRCWVHFEDVELLYPSAQSGRTKKVIPSDKENSGGIVSGPLSTIAKGISDLGNNVPLISSVTGPPSWFLDSLSKGFAAFGFSNSVDTSTRSSYVPRIMSHSNNCDINDTTDSHGLFAGNRVAHLDGFAGKDFDELSIQYIASIPGFFAAFNFATTNNTGDTLWSTLNDVSTPANTFTVTTATGAKSLEWHYPAAYVAKMFTYWRGSMVYKFYAAKTTFHTGRILFAFTPNNTLANNTYALSVYTTRYIWDISQTSEFEITIPYVSISPWQSTDSYAGTLKAFVLNELEAPTTVASTIEILVEARAGPDFELAVPKIMDDEAVLIQSAIDNIPKNHRKYKNLYIMDDTKFLTDRKIQRKKRYIRVSRLRDSKLSNAYCQAPLQPSMGGVVDDGGGFYINRTKLDEAGYNSMFTTGETIKSLRSLLKRSMPIIYNLTSTTGAISTSYSPHVLWYCNVVAGAGNEKFPATNNIARDYFNYVGALFASHRGSMVVRVIPASATAVRMKSVYIPDQLIWYCDPSGSVSSTVSNGSSNIIYSQSPVQGAIDVHVPFYSLTHSRINYHGKYDSSNASGTAGTQFRHGNLKLGLSAGDTTSQFRADILRQIGDDFSFGGFIGVMPICGNYLNVTPNN